MLWASLLSSTSVELCMAFSAATAAAASTASSLLLLAACCMQASLFELVNAFASFLDQFQVLLESDHEINGVMGIAPLRTNQEFRRQVQGQHRRVDSLSCSIWAVLCSNGAVIVGGVL